MGYNREVMRNKYGNVKTIYNGRKFDSKKEANHAASLEILRNARDSRERVERIDYQVPFHLDMGAVHICNYIADFVVKYADGRKEVQDVKGFRTDVYKIKKKLMFALKGINIIEY